LLFYRQIVRGIWVSLKFSKNITIYNFVNADGNFFLKKKGWQPLKRCLKECVYLLLLYKIIYDGESLLSLSDNV